ncbi:high affinity copper uptake protein 1 isoform X2 [Macrosteles quadrilineatus]|uniref:high affinity copper uptake protein 1 isoform X2 n=1 Tax=Macrosteles quadrilineatus TaxID=74068 RepID=UPI0023E1D26C|nr:high affinity copper uptake protein 1 isoform X2 [Macrosteles quadrilineatus]
MDMDHEYSTINMSEHHHMDHEHLGHAEHASEDHMHSVAEIDPSSIDHSQHTDHSMHAGMNMAQHSMSHMMMMYFHFGYEETILFSFWKTTSPLTLGLSMIGIFLLAALYEGLKYFREYLFWKQYNALQYRSVETPANKGTGTDENPSVQPSMLSRDHLLQTILHVLQFIISYLLMLIFMTFNVWLCLAVTLGAGSGYFLFGWKKPVFISDLSDHCH